MYGRNVHQAVLDAHEKESGITIHKVNKEYDKGEILCQAKFNIEPSDDISQIESKIHALEFIHLPKTIETLLAK
jgi:phosphoribosylglycinamide formyltransferase-1